MPFVRCPNLWDVAFLFFTRWRRLTRVAICAPFDHRVDRLSYGCWRIVPSIGAFVPLALSFRGRDLPWLFDIGGRRRIVLAAL